MATVGKRVGVWTACVVTAAVLAARPAAADDPKAKELVKQALEALPKQSFTTKLKLTTPPTEPRMLELNHKLVNGARSSYLEVVGPAELQGVRFLFLEHPEKAPEQYMKVAASRTTVRVADEVRKQPFLGSAFYIADLVEPAVDNFTYKFAGDANVSGRACKLVEISPKDPQKEVYGKTIAAIDPKDLLILRRELFDHKGKPLKLWTVEVVEKIDDVWTLRDQRMKNLQNDMESRLEVTEVKYNVELPDAMFTPKHLLR
jgi:outer membrane lipoprotein-sorting protein